MRRQWASEQFHRDRRVGDKTIHVISRVIQREDGATAMFAATGRNAEECLAMLSTFLWPECECWEGRPPCRIHAR
ncbi:MAG TPA: hypothetical protein VFW94_23905 [Candidatus Acidoferrales bacterium]|nr:hypothetical protein [Candidatus Acidoferrales bacterium]